jgi:fructoselysine-6-P-deglycase FrlB-like protein
VNSRAFLADVGRIPATLSRLADTLRGDNPWAAAVPPVVDRVVLLGMGSSAYANAVAAARMRARGAIVTAEPASSRLLPEWGSGTLAVAVSAGGGSVETLDAVTRLPVGTPTVALTNTAGSPLTQACGVTVPLDADVETGGVACRSYVHTLALLLALESHLTGGTAVGLADTVDRAAEAAAHLLDIETGWLADFSELLLGPHGTYFAAPAHRLCSAQQSALMLREGPRLAATGCETGDWSHVDVYLTKTLDYRLLVYAGSRWEAQMAEWTTSRGSTVVAVGGEVPGARYELRYPGDTDDDVALLAETVVADLIAGRRWERDSP